MNTRLVFRSVRLITALGKGTSLYLADPLSSNEVVSHGVDT